MNSSSTTQIYPKPRIQSCQKVKHLRAHTPVSIYTINKSESTTIGFQSNQAQELKTQISQALAQQNQPSRRVKQLNNFLNSNSNTYQTDATKKALSNTMLLLMKERTRVASAHLKSQLIKNLTALPEWEANNDIWEIQSQIMKQRKFLKSAQDNQHSKQQQDLAILPSIQTSNNSHNNRSQTQQQQLIYCSKDLQEEITQNFAKTNVGMRRAQSSKLFSRNLQKRKSLNKIQEQQFQFTEESSSQMSSRKDSKVILEGKNKLSQEAQKYFSGQKFVQIQNLLNNAATTNILCIDNSIKPEKIYKSGNNIVQHLQKFCPKKQIINIINNTNNVNTSTNTNKINKKIPMVEECTKKNKLFKTKQTFFQKKVEQEKVVQIIPVIEEPQENLSNFDEEELLKQKREELKEEQIF